MGKLLFVRGGMLHTDTDENVVVVVVVVVDEEVVVVVDVVARGQTRHNGNDGGLVVFVVGWKCGHVIGGWGGGWVEK